jgi:FKBP-type peptidyl-prolyl cis-trans isomerase FklB
MNNVNPGCKDGGGVMKLFAVLTAVFFMAAVSFAQEDAVLKTEKDRLSYAIGMDIGNGLKRQDIDLNAEIVAQGIWDSMSGGKTLMTEQESRQTMDALKQELARKQMAKMKELGDKNKKEGEKFLAENRTKDGVIALPSGLQYKVVRKGTGKPPKAGDTVTVNYRGTFIDGTEFDSSYRRGQPASFTVSGVIPGWTEALQLMKEGAKWELYIPPDLAYGERGAGRSIGPNATLIFEVELLSVKE